MLQELYSCGYIVNYDEVVKFKQCSARFLLQEKRLLSQDPPPVVNGLISAWFDNFDVVVFTTIIHGEFWHCQFLQCAIPLLHPKKPIPNTTKPAVTLSDQDLWAKSEINTVQQSLKRAQKEDIKWLINNIAGVKSLENMELNISNGSRIF